MKRPVLLLSLPVLFCVTTEALCAENNGASLF
jgi:hypothetical protein